MKEAGKIIEIKGEMAVVELARTKACETCRVCLTSSDSYKMIAEARNAINANIGDEIYLELESRSVILASLIVYILPLSQEGGFWVQKMRRRRVLSLDSFVWPAHTRPLVL
jgi:positive regulator of sigma E activity